jgi:hypothetical protein
MKAGPDNERQGQGDFYLCQLLNVCADLLFLVNASPLKVKSPSRVEIKAPVT